MSAHLCHAIGCTVEVAPRFLMCRQHWSMVPAHLQQEVWAHYRPGQERDKRPSEAYLDAATRARHAVCEKSKSAVSRKQLTLGL